MTVKELKDKLNKSSKQNRIFQKTVIATALIGMLFSPLCQNYHKKNMNKRPTPSKTPIESTYTPTPQPTMTEPVYTCPPCPTSTRTASSQIERTLTRAPTKTKTNYEITYTPTSTPNPTRTSTATSSPTKTVPTRTATEDPAKVILYKGTNYQGAKIRLEKGGSIKDLTNVKGSKGQILDFNNSISSIKVDPEFYVVLYDEFEYKGLNKVLTESTPDWEENWKASSFAVYPKSKTTKSSPTNSPAPTSTTKRKGKLKVNNLEYEVTESDSLPTFSTGNYNYVPIPLNKEKKGNRYTSLEIALKDRWEINYTNSDGKEENAKVGELNFPAITTSAGEYIVFHVPQEILDIKYFLSDQDKTKAEPFPKKIKDKELANVMICPSANTSLTKSKTQNNYTLKGGPFYVLEIDTNL